MDDLLVRIRTQVENATAPIEPSELHHHEGPRRSLMLSLAAVIFLVIVVAAVALRVGSDAEPGTLTVSGPSAPERLDRSVQTIEVTGPGTATRVDIVFNGPLPRGNAVFAEDITVIEDPALSFTTQSVNGTVWMCDVRHFGFGPSATGGSIDVLIPSNWVHPSGVQVPEDGLHYSDSIDHPGKILACGPYKGYVQYTIWGGASIDPNRISVETEGNTITVRVGPPER